MENNKVMKIAALGLVGLVIGPTIVKTGCKLVGCAANRLIRKRDSENDQADAEIIEVAIEETI